MEAEKPFKTIEVVDSRTNQVCKIACMSCIRGHRTTSCGIPVCRPKIFWTVKRPGRPSNSCTCRYGATGGCKCVVARSACPHKSKKGEKRSGECRCDEQGRYCCLLEPEHWSSLLSLQKPTVDFFPTREALEAKQMASAQELVAPQTPSYSSVTSPPMTNSIPGTPAPAPQGRVQPVHIVPNTFQGYPPMQSPLTPRFGMMGIGAPMGTNHNAPPDLLAWQGQAPTAPRDYNPSQMYEAQPQQQQQGSCCQPSTPSQSVVHSPELQPIEHTFRQAPVSMSEIALSTPGYHEIPPQTVTLAQLSPPPQAFDFNKLQTDYFNYQFPSAICQNCGLNGCTCRNCPPVLQNFGNGSWAQCCGRKHARDVQPVLAPAPQKIPRTGRQDAAQTRQQQQQQQQTLAQQQHPPPNMADPAAVHQQHQQFTHAPFQPNGNHFDAFSDLGLPPPSVPPIPNGHEFDAFDLDPDLIMPDGADLADLSEFLLSDLDRSGMGNPHGTAGGGNFTGGVEDDAGDDDDRIGGGGGGGCCCR